PFGDFHPDLDPLAEARRVLGRLLRTGSDGEAGDERACGRKPEEPHRRAAGHGAASRSGLPSTLTQFDTARTPSGPARPQWTVPGAMRRPSPGESVTSGSPERETRAEPPMT